MKPLYPKAFIAIHWHVYSAFFQDELSEVFRILFDKAENGQDCKLSHSIPTLKNTELRTKDNPKNIHMQNLHIFHSFKCYHLFVSVL